MTVTLCRMTVVAAVVLWLWLAIGFAVTGPELLILRGALLGLGTVLFAILLSGSRKGYLAVLGICYALVLGPFLSATVAGIGQGEIRMVQIDIEGLPQQQIVEFVPRDVLRQDERFAALRHADTSAGSSEAYEEAAAVQTVGRSLFSPMELGGY